MSMLNGCITRFCSVTSVLTAWVPEIVVKELLTTAENQYYIQSKKQAGYNNSQKTT